MARKLKIMENEKHPLDDLKNDEIPEKRDFGRLTVPFLGMKMKLLPRSVRSRSTPTIS